MNNSSNLSTSHWAHTWWRHCKDLSTLRLRSESQNRRSFARFDYNRILRTIITPQRGWRWRMHGALSPLPTLSLHGDNPHKNKAEELAWKMERWRLVLKSKKYHIWLISISQREKVKCLTCGKKKRSHMRTTVLTTTTLHNDTRQRIILPQNPHCSSLRLSGVTPGSAAFATFPICR